jgi:hypothetical protein
VCDKALSNFWSNGNVYVRCSLHDVLAGTISCTGDSIRIISAKQFEEAVWTWTDVQWPRTLTARLWDTRGCGRDAPLSYDQTHVFVASQVYELPVGKGKKLLNRGGPLS